MSKKRAGLLPALGRPGEARTLDPMIKSHVLYQLSYEPIFKEDTNLILILFCQNKINLF